MTIMMLRRHDEGHDHQSDEEEEEEEHVELRQRSRSFSDAEDIISQGGYYQSFEIESPPPPHHPSTLPNHHHNGLHHRAIITATPTTTTTTITPHRSPLQNRIPSISKQLRGQTSYASTFLKPRKHNHSIPTRRICRWCVFVGFATYVGLLIRSSYWLLQTSKEQAVGLDSIGMVDPSRTTPLISSATTRHQQRVVLLHDTKLKVQMRANERRQRTRPTTTTSSSSSSQPTKSLHSHNSIAWYSTTTQRNNHPPRSSSLPTMAEQQEDVPLLATLDQLCGFHAQNASLANPQLYPTQFALGQPKARVLITGILNPLGFPLALHLNRQCGVQVIAGMDTMYPNTILNRLELTQRMKLLTTQIPKMIKPIVLPFVGLDPKQKGGGSEAEKEELDVMTAFKPTHIVHLASYSQDAYSDAMIDLEWKNSRSPYQPEPSSSEQEGTSHSPHMYQLRSSMVGMEQILSSLANTSPEERPQLIYATTTTTQTNPNIENPVHTTTKRIDEMLTDTYHSLHGISSIGLRLSNLIYGPWGKAGSLVHDLVESAIQQWNTTTKATTTTTTTPASTELQPQRSLDMVYLEDAIDAIVAAMQYKTSDPILADVTSGRKTSVSSIVSAINSLLPNKDDKTARPPFTIQHSPLEPASSSSSSLLPEWSTKTSIQDGLVKTMAWHLDRSSPYGPPKVETGDSFLKRIGKETCAADDLTCHMAPHYLPCASECNTRDQCLPSVFDPVRELIHNVTEGCDIVLYTQSMGYNVQDLELHSEYMDDTALGDEDDLLCNFAFVPRDSDLVNSVASKVPNDQLAKFGIKPEQSDVGKAMKERKLDGLNGRLLYRGWILIWVKGAIEPLSVTDRSLLKLSPGNFFHPDVHSALFVEENFSVSPNIEDVLFLTGEVRRKALVKRTLKVTLPETKQHVQFILPAEPTRRAAILFAPLRVPNVPNDSTVQQYRQLGNNKKLSLHDAVKFMRYEELGVDHLDKEPADVRRQREFYERIPSYLNKNSEMRSDSEPWYRYSMRHWVRTRWVVHDLKLEDSRLLRCDWYQEHVQWGTDIDQLSFAHVMASREVKRRIAHFEPDDHVKSFIEEHPELRDYTDSYEWHPMETELNRLYREPTKWQSQLPAHIRIIEDEQGDREQVDSQAEPGPLYIRIMSEKVMAASRKIWVKQRKQQQRQKDSDQNKK